MVTPLPVNKDRSDSMPAVVPRQQEPRPTAREAASIALQTAVAGVAALLLYRELHLPSSSAAWCVVSAVLVFQPKMTDARDLALARCAANILGATIGALAGSLLGVNWTSLGAATLIVVLLCYAMHLDSAVKSACACVAIVMFTQTGNVKTAGAERVVAVVIGCGSAVLAILAFTGLTHVTTKLLSRRQPAPK
jgi:uncharacterized membrane protein YgaE (UPF0421/DUF939 family)